MLNEYLLMHKNVKAGIVQIDSDDGKLVRASITRKEFAPFFGNADLPRMKRWWEMRAVPGGRKRMEEIIRKAGCMNPQSYLIRNLGLSLTDTYWLNPVSHPLRFEDVNLYDMEISADGVLPYHNATSYDPNASLGGQLEKYWDITCRPFRMVKTSWRAYGQQSVNELFATEIHRRLDAGIPYVSYSIERIVDGGVASVCEAFTSAGAEFITAYEIIESVKTPGDRSLYDAYIDICAANGIDREVMQRFMDYQTLTDFVISNSDEHLMNFGVLRDSDSLRFISPAPIFNSGNSMFFEDNRRKPFTRRELLDRKITAFHDTEEKMLSHVKNRSIVDITRLPSEDEVREFYITHGIPEEKASFIAGSYAVKVSLLKDFAEGKKISRYHVRKG